MQASNIVACAVAVFATAIIASTCEFFFFFYIFYNFTQIIEKNRLLSIIVIYNYCNRPETERPRTASERLHALMEKEIHLPNGA